MAFSDKIAGLREQIESIDLSEVQADNFGSWPMPIKVVTWVAVLILLVVAGYYLVISDMIIQQAKAVDNEVQLKSEFETKAYKAANLDAYRKQMVEMDESFSALISQLPGDTEVPGLLEDITSKGSASGLDFQSIDLLDEKSAEFYVQLPIQIVAVGTYHDMGAFVSGVAGLPRIVTLTDFTIKPQGDLRDNSLLEIKILASTYRYKSQSDGDAGKKKKRKR